MSLFYFIKAIGYASGRILLIFSDTWNNFDAKLQA